ncbi:hypothetical protein NO1_1368 [Candidatus Termititenax aidoneus]|uniref:Uncharacterized protein n=1 Tax=Termititenax aidoneus TaxID=2218524 RepID=A0A388TBH4_TERA1|nr:hypothetical protein NO1_1368 [Candidatus Termititenax aidoneus]
MLSKKDLEVMSAWGIKIYPCKIEKDGNGIKKKALFPRKGVLTPEWKFWADKQQADINNIWAYVSKRPDYGFACVLPDNVAVIDCDDAESYHNVKEIFNKAGASC